MAQKNKLEVKNFKIDEIHPYENNPRFNKDAVSKVAASIKKFGFKNPILVDKNMVIIAGHTRLEAAKKLKLDEVPCIVAADLNEKQAKALRLADNKVAEFSTWDYLKLDEELNGLGDAFDFADFGFGGALADDSFGAGNSAGGSFVETDDIPDGSDEDFHEENKLPEEIQGVDISAGVQEKIVGSDEVPMERVIIVFKKEEREALCKILGMKEGSDEDFHEENKLPEEIQGVDISAGVQEKIVGSDEVPMEQVILVFKKEEREALCKILGLKEISKVVYRLDELNAVR